MKTLEELQQENKRIVHDAAVRNCWDGLFRRHSDCNCEANRQLIEGFLAGQPVTEKNLEQAYQHLTAEGKLAHVTNEALRKKAEADKRAAEAAEETERERLIETILKQRMSPEMRNQMARQLRFRDPFGHWTVSLETLRQKAADVDARHDLRSLGKDALREQIRNGRPEPTCPTLPAFYRHKMNLLCLSSPEMRKFIQKYGVEQINQALRGELPVE